MYRLEENVHFVSTIVWSECVGKKTRKDMAIDIYDKQQWMFKAMAGN